ncbi:MAG: type I-E CRISPR-associated protein Cse1/CasA, partial [Acidobacteria bacterium]|nr:type I-E CRISPR-associated protein Cse1/CasA [Acidobacteriota bacterium]
MHSMLNLIRDPWLPVRRRSGHTETIAPWAVNDRINTDPVTSFAWPRPELNAASVELLIGILATGLPAAGDPDAAWQWGWSEPPAPDALRARLERLAPFFELIADGAPAFLQDLDPLAEASVSNPARLLFDTPGAQTAKLNTDLFRRRAADDTVLSLPAAAIALYAHMSWCASDGVGYRVGLRGGGPLSTLPVLGHRRLGDTLWGQAWPAVRIRREDDPDWSKRPERVFAWLAATPTSRPEDGHRPLGPDDMHALHAHWGMPRRVRLVAGPAAGRACAVTGHQIATAVVGVRMRNYGIDY